MEYNQSEKAELNRWILSLDLKSGSELWEKVFAWNSISSSIFVHISCLVGDHETKFNIKKGNLGKQKVQFLNDNFIC